MHMLTFYLLSCSLVSISVRSVMAIIIMQLIRLSSFLIIVTIFDQLRHTFYLASVFESKYRVRQ
jgi:hypothetical protein